MAAVEGRVGCVAARRAREGERAPAGRAWGATHAHATSLAVGLRAPQAPRALLAPAPPPPTLPSKPLSPPPSLPRARWRCAAPQSAREQGWPVAPSVTPHPPPPCVSRTYLPPPHLCQARSAAARCCTSPGPGTESAAGARWPLPPSLPPSLPPCAPQGPRLTAQAKLRPFSEFI